MLEVRKPKPDFFGGKHKVPYVPTSFDTAKRMLRIAKVGPGDVVFDLGCGDGRLLILAIVSFKAKKAMGYEIRKDLCNTAKKEVEERKLREHITIVNGDLFNADLSKATVITLYLTYSANRELKPKLIAEVKPGTRIVSHDFEIPGWTPIVNACWRVDSTS